MKTRVSVRPEAARDLTDAALWYEARSAGLGLRFVSELDQVLERVAKVPTQFPLVGDSCRRGLLRRFPYGVYFVLRDDLATVIAVLHMHRHPDAWQSRA